MRQKNYGGEMEYEIRMERNRESPRITEIPLKSAYKKLECPYCHKPLQVGLEDGGTCVGVTTVCKNCKRALMIGVN